MTKLMDVTTITIRKRSWWFWTVAGLWLAIEVLLLQTALASVREFEPRAAIVCGIIAVVLAGAGVIAWRYRGNPSGHDEAIGKP